MNRIPLQTEIEAILPALFAVKGSEPAVQAAHDAAECLLDLIDASARGEIIG